MTLKLSEISEYKEYVFNLSKKNYLKAEDALKKCIILAKQENDREALIFFTQNLGDLFFLKGDRENALAHYEKAEALDVRSVLSKYFFARFLFEKLKQYERAIGKCNEIIQLASTEIWQDSEYDFSSEHYLALSYSLRGYCYALIKDFESAAKDLLQLLFLKKEKVIDHSIDFCELMIINRKLVNEAKEYLTNLLTALKNKDTVQYENLIARIEEILRK